MMKHFSPPIPVITEAARLYRGDVMHQRMQPVGHRFSYQVFSLLIDLDRLGEADRMSRFFSVNSFNCMGFYEQDHIRGSSAPGLRQHVDALLADAGVAKSPSRILLACFPRVFGKVFNPLSVFYAYNETDQLIALIYQVRNTFGQDHNYVCPIKTGEATSAGIRQTRTKSFYVSPFLDMGLTYHFRMTAPADTLKWRILETGTEGPLLSATYAAQAQKLSNRTILANLLQFPLLMWKIVAGIHFEALRLWLKGVAIVPRPASHTAVPKRGGESDATTP